LIRAVQRIHSQARSQSDTSAISLRALGDRDRRSLSAIKNYTRRTVICNSWSIQNLTGDRAPRIQTSLQSRALMFTTIVRNGNSQTAVGETHRRSFAGMTQGRLAQRKLVGRGFDCWQPPSTHGIARGSLRDDVIHDVPVDVRKARRPQLSFVSIRTATRRARCIEHPSSCGRSACTT
jgi:hypothetical protein